MADEELKVTPPEGSEEKETGGKAPEEKAPEEKAPQGNQEAKPDPMQAKARAYGWVPEEEFTGDKTRWVDAKEFMSRAPLFERIDHYRKRVDDLEGTVQDMKKHYQKIDETAYKRAIADLKKEKLQALEEENHARVIELDEAMLDLKTEQKTAKQKETTRQQTGPSGIYQQWVDNNPWYEANQEMRDAADGLGMGYFNRNPGKSEAEVLGYVTQKMKQLYPETFQNKARTQPNQVESSRPAPPSKKKPSWSDLSDIQKEVATKFVKTGVMTREQYIADLRKIGEI